MKPAAPTRGLPPTPPRHRGLLLRIHAGPCACTRAVVILKQTAKKLRRLLHDRGEICRAETPERLHVDFGAIRGALQRAPCAH